MSLKECVYSVLVVSASERFNVAVKELLPSSGYQPVHIATNVSEAKRYIAAREVDFVIINSPLPDESGTRFAIDCCRSQTTVVLILSRSDVHAEVHDKVAEHGVFTLSKPTSKNLLLQALSWMSSTRERLRKMEQKTSSIEERMEEIRIVNRAKCLLISKLKMTEPEAHHYIEKNAMDNCIRKKEAAENIIHLYS
ncbi:Probable transcriptional regulatory protein pdtaR [uncultured Ruminococcus sp.]|uniref:Stage 0 sporulation protein A homolog n=1 Tax=Massiliimalia timonensis TaxID=1987501 RepID=A0A8J6TQQ9_9FIRM|nr:ANTAR domain-containing protein [Massiliimalia timonensis]MBC8609506.1 ANTAR domain-containing protein [Massiliimalia timonensis]SCH40786.1 Probable transcriptional regulatory protein pdtaR [uncultured Ruminococcus sp.]SCH41984.1 Probable transcriptional regulatory protein pdtaR [uncultured Clostridium sp.]